MSLREVLIYDRNKGKAKDDAILTVLNEVIKRPLFLGLHHVVFDTSVDFHQQLLHMYGKDEFDREIVGSSRDGLKCSRVFCCGDVDSLLYSALTLDQSDEATFEYRQDYPAYFHFPHPENLKDLPKVDNKYLNPNHLRRLNSLLFPRAHEQLSFTILPQEIHASDVKCAITKTLSYTDPCPHQSGSPTTPKAVDYKLFTAWQIEHTVLSYLLGLRNHKEITFIRELMYGFDVESFDELTEKMKQLISYWRKDFHMTLLGIYDLLHFDSEDMKCLLHAAVDEIVVDKHRCNPSDVPHGEFSADIVPAFKCSGWPRPANDFKTRKRLWPSQDVVNSIVTSGFQVVARGCLVDPEPEKDFILSFSPSEAKLVYHLPSEAKTAYCILKSCYKCAVGKKSYVEKKYLKSYHMKTALFWVAENVGLESWMDIDHLQAIRTITDFLINCLKEIYLPHYFIPENNLIGDFNRIDADASIDILTEIQENPASFIQVILDTEWEYTKTTSSSESYNKMRHDREYMGSFNWQMQVKFSVIGLAQAGDYPVDDMSRGLSYFHSQEFQARYFRDPLNTTPPWNIADTFAISENQLDDVDTFVQTISHNNMDLFNVLDQDIGSKISECYNNGLKEEILQMYKPYDSDADKTFGAHFLAMSKLRLKFYANVFHFLTVKLLEASLQPSVSYRNKDAVYIVKFLQQLLQRKGFDQEKVEDLLHYLLYFCHFTVQRHHTLSMTDQMLRSIREFLQDAKHLMTVYFNPKLEMPVPLDLGDVMVTTLKECFCRTSATKQKHLVDLALD